MKPWTSCFPWRLHLPRRDVIGPAEEAGGPLPFWSIRWDRLRGIMNSQTPDAPSPRWLPSVIPPRCSKHTVICQSDRAPLPATPLASDMWGRLDFSGHLIQLPLIANGRGQILHIYTFLYLVYCIYLFVYFKLLGVFFFKTPFFFF